MQNPDERDLNPALQDTQLQPYERLDYGDIEPTEPAPAPYVKEPLFNKKVMLAWAVGAAFVWFVVSFVIPIAFESAKVAIVDAVKEAQTKNGGTITIKRNGEVISITRTPAPPAGATTAAPAATTPPAAAPKTPQAPVDPSKTKGPAKAEPSKK